MVKFVLRDIDVRHIPWSTIEEVGKDHPVDGLVAYDHDVVGIAAQIKRFFNPLVYSVFH